MSDDWFDTIVAWSPDAKAPPDPPDPPPEPVPPAPGWGPAPPWEWGSSRRGAPDPFLVKPKETVTETAEETLPGKPETVPQKPPQPPGHPPGDLRKEAETSEETPKETVPAERAPQPQETDSATPQQEMEPTSKDKPEFTRWHKIKSRASETRTAVRKQAGLVRVPGVPRPVLRRFTYAAAVGWIVGPGTLLAAYDRLVIASGSVAASMPGHTRAVASPHPWHWLTGPGHWLRDALWGLWRNGRHAEATTLGLAAIAIGLVVAGAVRIVPAALAAVGALLATHVALGQVPPGWDLLYGTAAATCLLYGLVVTGREGIRLSQHKGIVGFVRMIPFACAVSAVLFPAAS